MAFGRFFSSSATVFEVSKYLLLTLVVLAAFFALVGVPLLISGESMKPNFRSGELVVIERISYWGDKPIQRGDVVAATFPGDPKRTRLIKRIVGLPGETVTAHGGLLQVNGRPLEEAYGPIIETPPYDELPSVTLQEDEYYLAGDNRPGSSDSRLWGPVTRSDIQGRAIFVIWPPDLARGVPRLD